MKFTIPAIAIVLAAGQALAQSNDAARDLALRSAAPDALSVSWLAAGPSDFGATTLITDPSRVPDSRHIENEAVRFAWKLDDAAATQDVRQARVESRQYWLDATGDELARGVELPLTARGAVVRVSPLNPDGDVRINPSRVRLAMKGKRLENAESLLRMVTDGQALNRQGMPVPPQTLAFKLDDAVPAGTLEFAIERLPSDAQMVVHVFEPESDWVAELSLPRHNFFAGDELSFDFGLAAGEARVDVESIQAVVADPFADQTWQLDVDAGRGRLSRKAPGERFVSGHEGLFEAYVYLETEKNGLTVRRDLKLPFSIAPPLARFDGRAQARLDGGLALTVGVATAAAGRFQVNGQIFGTAADGSLKPLAIAQAAATLAPGTGSLELKVDRSMLAASGLRAPFEVRNLELLDQGRMFMLERRARAFVAAP
ncbi:MAG: DUF4785 domain-containing protein [Candidatus Wenzhouxiangella sp. M2_3B_020]